MKPAEKIHRFMLHPTYYFLQQFFPVHIREKYLKLLIFRTAAKTIWNTYAENQIHTHAFVCSRQRCCSKPL